MTPASKLSRIRAIVLIGFTLAVIHHYIQSSYLGRHGLPYSTFLFEPSNKFWDFLSLQTAARTLNPYSYSGSVYFPFAFISLAPFIVLKDKVGLYAYLISSLALMWSYCASSIKRLGTEESQLSTFILLLMSYPVLFVLDRANFEAWVWVFVSFFFTAFRKRRFMTSAVLLGCAAAIKGYPVLFCLLFLVERRYRETLMVLLTALVASVASTFAYKSGFVGSFQMLANNLSWFRDAYVMSTSSLVFSSSLSGFLRITLSPFISGLLPVEPRATLEFSRIYTAIAALLQLGSIAWVLFGTKVLWKRTFLIVASFILLPPVSFDYKLIHLLFPLLLFLESPERSKFDGIYAGLFGLLLIPKAYWLISDQVFQNGGETIRFPITSTSVLTPVLLVVFVGLLALDRRRAPISSQT